MYIMFVMKETSYNRYSVNVPHDMRNATDEELKEWLKSGKAFDKGVEFVKSLDIIESELDTDYEFTVIRK
ncbi:MAG: hypothetical protein IJG43_07905 [Acidaminococcaceae bacterium]|nr:hypothetical protein [Acidaminococcaceae bacterium]